MLAMKGNPARRSMYVWVGITIVAMAGIFLPVLLDLNAFGGTFTTTTLCFFVAAAGLVITIMYAQRARTIDAIVGGTDLLAHWHYTPHEWQTFMAKAYRRERQDKWQLFTLVVVIAIVAGFAFWLFRPASAAIVAVVLVGLFILLALTIFVSTTYNYWQSRRHPGEVYIALGGAYINQELHLWRSWGARLKAVDYKADENVLEITYAIPGNAGQRACTLRVPVPAGEEKTAQGLLTALAPKEGLRLV